MSITSRPKDKGVNLNPGPGAYNPLLRSNAKVLDFGSGGIRDGSLSMDQNPGPGTYSNTIRPIGSDVPQYSFRGKLKERDPNDMPGPGHYDYD